jgi:pyruvate formate lyase activating enzyme
LNLYAANAKTVTTKDYRPARCETMRKEAKYYQSHNNYMECQLCPHYCKIKPGQYGLCRSRKNDAGKLWATDYGESTSIAIDPIEKKPLYHFYPGSKTLSIAPNSCNMRCPFCQNWELSQTDVRTDYLTPDTLLKIFKEHPSIGISYTYTEPFMWFEYLLDVGELIHNAGGKNILVTNGMINKAPLQEILPLIDAMNIDLKTMDSEIYQKTLGGDLETVKQTIILAHDKCHIELTNLLVTGLNDRKRDINKLIDYVASIDKDIPLHFSRYYPNYHYEKPPTHEKKLEYAYVQAKEKINYVYLGNILTDDGSNTYCPKCNNLLIERVSFQAMVIGLKGKKCKNCGEPINIIM